MSEGDSSTAVNDMNVMNMIQNLFLNDSTSPSRNPVMSPAKYQSNNGQQMNQTSHHHSLSEGLVSRNPLSFTSNLFRSDNHFFGSSDVSNQDFALNGRTMDYKVVDQVNYCRQPSSRGGGGGILTTLDGSPLRLDPSPLPSSQASFFGNGNGNGCLDLGNSIGTHSAHELSTNNGNQSGISPTSLLSVPNGLLSTASPSVPVVSSSNQAFNSQTFQLLNNASELLGSLLPPNHSGRAFPPSIPGPVGQRTAPVVGSDFFSGRVYSPIEGFSNGSQNLKGSFSSQPLPEVQLEKFESHIRCISSEIQQTIQMHVNGLLSRKDHLLHQLETVRKMYSAIYHHQSNKNGSLNDTIINDLMILPSISFTKPDHALYKAVSSMGFLTTPAFAPYCSASGDGLEAAVPGQAMTFVIVTKNCFNEELMVGRENILARIVAFSEPYSSRSGTLDSGYSSVSGGDFITRNKSSSNLVLPANSPSSQNCLDNLPGSNGHSCLVKAICNASISDHNNGKYTVTYTLPSVSPGGPTQVHVEITVLVNGMPMTGCPFKVNVRAQHRQSWKKVASYGSDGNSIGQFCRPWGVAITKLPSSLTVCVQLMSDQSSLDGNGSLSSGSPSSSSAAINCNGAAINCNGPAINCNGSQISPSSLTDGDSTSTSSLSPTSSGTSLPSNSSTNHSLHQTNNGTSMTVSGYLIAVADRSNNRIQVFKFDELTSQMTPLYVFGSGPGTAQGQFDRPAGICFNVVLGHIVVADKDNHRVQVFDLSGRFLLKFGEKGSRAGQFCYPWDIESCPSTHQLIVSDTRNRRIQLFTPYGQYMTHFAQPLDSPRGVAFLSDSRILVSDFNKHRLMIFDRSPGGINGGINGDHRQAHHTSAHSHHLQSLHSQGVSAPSTPTPPTSLSNGTRFIGFGEGSGWGEFLRPQGIAVSGHYAFCADSRNNRVCLYNLVTQTFEYLSEDLGLDRPSGIAVVDNIMIVVDFGNNRLLVCRR